MNDKLVDIVIVNWNSRDQLAACVDSIRKFVVSDDCNVVVVDNGSTDGSADGLPPAGNLSVIRTGENLGFGKACNLGASQARSRFVLFLNPDARLYQDTLSKAIDFMNAPENAIVGICGVQLQDEAGHVSQSCTRFPGVTDFTCHALGLDRWFPKLGHFMSEWAHDTTQLVDHVMGAFFLVRREVFEKLGGFDERFFVYLEDLDFSYRAKQAGWDSVYLADVQAFHYGGGTSNQVKARRLFYSLRSQLLYAFKHFYWIGALWVFLVTLLVEPVTRIFFAVIRGSLSSVKETLAGYAMLWKWLPDWIFKGVTR